MLIVAASGNLVSKRPAEPPPGAQSVSYSMTSAVSRNSAESPKSSPMTKLPQVLDRERFLSGVLLGSLFLVVEFLNISRHERGLVAGSKRMAELPLVGPTGNSLRSAGQLR